MLSLVFLLDVILVACAILCIRHFLLPTSGMYRKKQIADLMQKHREVVCPVPQTNFFLYMRMQRHDMLMDSLLKQEHCSESVLLESLVYSLCLIKTYEDDKISFVDWVADFERKTLDLAHRISLM
eukprot:310983-Hanusia_phi.AAC.2